MVEQREGPTLVELKGITKRFPGVLALSDVDFTLRAGEVHGLVGENGAGKSTLIKILSGAHEPDEGQILLLGKDVRLKDPQHAQHLGIACIYQELNLVQEMSITDNVFLGHQLKKRGLLDYRTMAQRVSGWLKELGQDLDPKCPIYKLGMGSQQMVEITKAFAFETRLIIMDEPTSSLGEGETEELKKIIRQLKARGIAILFVSHKLDEVLEICDTITVFRDGRHIQTLDAAGTTKEQLIQLMVGRAIDHQYPTEERTVGTEELLRVEGFTSRGVYRDVSFSLRQGEILGFYGLVGAGRTELMRGIFGADPIDAGALYVKGRPVTVDHPYTAIGHGMAFLTEDRKGQGLFLGSDVAFNLLLPVFARMKKRGFLDAARMKDTVDRNIGELRIKTPSPRFTTRQLSGGNQQKVVIGKWLNTDASIFIFDEPTRGIDVGAKQEVYRLMVELAKRGAGIVMVSSELPEIVGMSDRVAVMHNGSITGTLVREARGFQSEEILKAALT